MTRIAVANSGDRRKGRHTVDTAALWSERGLAVHQTHGSTGWTITHTASGYAILQGIGSQRNALVLAKRLLDAGDWTRSRTAVTSDPTLKDRARDIVTQARLLGLVKS